MAVVQIQEKDFDSIIQAGQPVLVDFFATWCGPCKMLSPVVDQLSEEIPDVKFVKVDVDEAQELAGRFNVMSIPTLAFFKDGKLANTIVGVQPKSLIESMLKS
ncbi:MAG: thioredoxin [Blautia sp.]|nr:thioredoxin [Blautia sp.]